MRILIIEDEAILALILEEFLTDAGFEVAGVAGEDRADVLGGAGFVVGRDGAIFTHRARNHRRGQEKNYPDTQNRFSDGPEGRVGNSHQCTYSFNIAKTTTPVIETYNHIGNVNRETRLCSAYRPESER